MSRFIAGTIVGITIGLLLAPKKGEEMRHDIVDHAERFKKKFDKMLGNTNAEVAELKKILGHEIDGLNDDVRQRLLNMIEETIDGGQRIGSNIKRGLA